MGANSRFTRSLVDTVLHQLKRLFNRLIRFCLVLLGSCELLGWCCNLLVAVTVAFIATIACIQKSALGAWFWEWRSWQNSSSQNHSLNVFTVCITFPLKILCLVYELVSSSILSSSFSFLILRESRSTKLAKYCGYLLTWSIVENEHLLISGDKTSQLAKCKSFKIYLPVPLAKPALAVALGAGWALATAGCAILPFCELFGKFADGSTIPAKHARFVIWNTDLPVLRIIQV